MSKWSEETEHPQMEVAVKALCLMCDDLGLVSPHIEGISDVEHVPTGEKRKYKITFERIS